MYTVTQQFEQKLNRHENYTIDGGGATITEQRAAIQSSTPTTEESQNTVVRVYKQPAAADEAAAYTSKFEAHEQYERKVKRTRKHGDKPVRHRRNGQETSSSNALEAYRTRARNFLDRIKRTMTTIEERSSKFDIDHFKRNDFTRQMREKEQIERLYSRMESSELASLESELHANELDHAWRNLVLATEERDRRTFSDSGIGADLGITIDVDFESAYRLPEEVGVTNEKLDRILIRIEEAEVQISSRSSIEIQETFDAIIDDLVGLEPVVDRLFQNVDNLKQARDSRGDEYYRLVFGLHQRRVAYLQRCGALLRSAGLRSEYFTRIEEERYTYTRTEVFEYCEECIEWVDTMTRRLDEMQFLPDPPMLEQMLEQHIVDHRDITDFRQQVDQCIGRQFEVSAEDSSSYCELLARLEGSYESLRELSRGRMVDLDSLLAFLRSSMQELAWIKERVHLEVNRDWSDITRLDLPMLENYYQQLMHEVELHEERFNHVYNQGAALLNQEHPAQQAISTFLAEMQRQWNWLIDLTRCLEVHLRDALNLREFLEDARTCEQWLERQTEWLNSHLNRPMTLEDGERLLQELDEWRAIHAKYNEILISLVARSRDLSPLWQRGERIREPIYVHALCNYEEANIRIQRGDQCVLLDNSDIVMWRIRDRHGQEGSVPSVIFRIPPPDARLLEYLRRLEMMSTSLQERYDAILTAIRNKRREKEEADRLRRAQEAEAAEKARRDAERARLEAERLRRQKEEEDAERARQEAERLRRLQEERDAAERARRDAELARLEAERLRRQQAEAEAERQRQAQAERAALERARQEAERQRRQQEADDAERERLRRLQEERDRDAAERARLEAERLRRLKEDADRARAEDEARRRQAEEDARRRQAEEDARRRQAEEEARRRQAEDDEEARRRQAEEEARRRQAEDDEEARRRQAEEDARRRQAEEEARRRQREFELKLQKGQQWGEGVPEGWTDEFDEARLQGDRAKQTEHEDEMEVYEEWTETRTKFYELETVRHLKTGEILTFVEALRQGLLDLKTGQYFDTTTKSHISLEEAVNRGYISQSMHECLQNRYGIFDIANHEDLTLLEATQRGIYDPESRQLRDSATGKLMSLSEALQKGVITADRVANLIKSGVLKLPAMHLRDAIDQGIVDPHTGAFTGLVSHKELPFVDALKYGYVTLPSPPTTGLGLAEVVEDRYLDSATATLTDRSTGETFTLREALMPENALINPHISEIANTEERRRISVSEAIAKGILNLRNASVKDVIQHQSMTLQEAYDKELIKKPLTLSDVLRQDLLDSTGKIIDLATKRRLTLLAALAEGFLDAHTPHIRDPADEGVISINEALETGLLNASGYFVDRKSGNRVPLTDALTSGHVVQPKRRTIFDIPAFKNTKDSTFVGFNQAVEQGIFVVPSERFVDLNTSETFLLHEAAKQGAVDTILHTALNRNAGIKAVPNHTVLRALVEGHIDHKEGMVADKSRNVKLHPREAYERGLLTLKGALLLSGLFNVRLPCRTGALHSAKSTAQHDEAHSQTTRTRQEVAGLAPSQPEPTTIVEAISEQYSKAYQVLPHREIPDGTVEETVSIVQRQRTAEATAEGGPGALASYLAVTDRSAAELATEKTGTASYEEKQVSWTFEASRGEIFDHVSGEHLSLDEAMKLRRIQPANIYVKDTISERFISYEDACKYGIIDSERNIFQDKVNNLRMSLQEAAKKGFVTAVPIPATGVRNALTSSLQENSRKVTATKQALEIGLPGTTGEIEPSNALADRVASGHKEAWQKVSMGYTHEIPKEFQGGAVKITVQDQYEPCATQSKTTVKSSANVQSLDLEPYAEMVGLDRVRDTRTGHVMSLHDAERRGLVKVQSKSKDVTKTYAAFKSDIVRAVNQGVVDASTGERMSLQDAIHSGIITVPNLMYHNASTGETVDIVQAANMGYVDVTLSEVLPKGVSNPANGERILLPRACELGIVLHNGQVVNPFNRQPLTWLDIVKPVHASLTTEGVYDPRQGHPIPLGSALTDGLIDANLGTYYNPVTQEHMPLEQASKVGLIDSESHHLLTKQCIYDHKSNSHISLLKAVQDNLVDMMSRTVEWQAGDVVPIARAAEEGKFPRDVASKLKKVEKLTFAEAVGKGLINLAAKQFTEPDSGKRITLDEAVQMGYIDTSRANPQEGAGKNSLAEIIKSDEFDPSSGRIHDRRSNLYLTFVQAVDSNLVDGNSLIYDTRLNQTFTLSDAVHQGRIDRDGKFLVSMEGPKLTIHDAVESGLIALIESPMQAGHAVAEAIIKREQGGPRVQTEYVTESGDDAPRRALMEETIVVKPTVHVAHPALSVRVRSDTDTLPKRPLADDPQTLAEKRRALLENLVQRGLNVDEQLLEHPETHRKISLKDAVEHGVLDIVTGNITNPTSKRQISIPKAMHMNMLSAAHAKDLMEAVNQCVEEFHRIHASPPTSYDATHPKGLSTDQTNQTYIKELSWRGKPSDLRPMQGVNPFPPGSDRSAAEDSAPTEPAHSVTHNRFVADDGTLVDRTVSHTHYRM